MVFASPIQMSLEPADFKKHGVNIKLKEHTDSIIHVTVTWTPKEPGNEGTRLDLLIWKSGEIGDRFYQGINEPDHEGNHSMVFMIAKEALSRSELVFRENQNVNYRLRLDELTGPKDPFAEEEPTKPNRVPETD